MAFESRTMNVESQWRGVPLTEIFGSQTPWGAPEFPLIVPGYNHSVLYHVTSDNSQVGERPPKAQIGHDKWDHDYVRMPCSSQSLYPVENDGSTSLKKRWEIIEESLQKPIKNSNQLSEVILSYNTKFKTVWKFRALHKLFNECLEEEEADFFFNVTLPEIARLALALPKLIQSPIPLLVQHKNRSISLSQQQIASLLANAFFCTFPRRNTTKRTSEYASYPHINFITLYESSGSDAVLEKLKCLCHYFRKVCAKVPIGVMTFMRRSVPPRQCPDWSVSTKLVAATPLHVNSTGTIEDDGLGLIQIDFANKYLGGGVLNRGCVQEEIRFVICPELLVSMLFTEVLRPNEALMMIGCERFSKYTGYGHSFRWAGDFQDCTPYDSSGRRRCAVLAIDALPFSNKSHEYKRDLIIREMNKAWVGMSTFTSNEDSLQHPGVATGNWGCGAFGGSADLKSLLQLMAATEARRPMAYYTFGDVELRNNIINIYNLLAKHNVTVGQLFKIITMFSTTADVRESQLYAFIHQSLIDQEKLITTEAIESMDTSNSREMHTAKEKANSPDLFSQDFDDRLPTDIKTSAVTSTNNCDNKVSKHSEQVIETERRNTEHTSRLSEEIGKFDSECGTLKLFDTERPINSNNRVQNTAESTYIKTTNYTSRFFEEMEKFDEESGNLNLKSSQKYILNKSTNAKTTLSVVDTSMLEKEIKNVDSKNDHNMMQSASEVQESQIEMTTDNDDLSMNVSPDIKKKISRKITDYFNRKT